MNKLFLIPLLALLITVFPAHAYAQQESYQLYKVTGERVSINDMGKLASQYDVIVFGEYHDNQRLHEIEEEFLKSSYQYQGKIAISLEMFEKDVQPVLDNYLKGDIQEKNFLAHTRPWNNYHEAYRPLVEFAKDNSLDVIAGNIPRSIASYYAGNGRLEGIPEEMKKYLPVQHRVLEGVYKKKFIDYMLLTGSNQKMKITPEKIENFYGAQCLKDDTMAESIIEYKDSHENHLVIHYNGDFHSNSYLGVVEKIKLLRPSVKVLVITPIYCEEGSDPKKIILAHEQEGDILILLKK